MALNVWRISRHRHITCILPLSQHFHRFNSTSTTIKNFDLVVGDTKLQNQELLTDLLKYASDRVIEPVQRELNLRPRYKRLTIDESHLTPEEILNSTDNYLTVNDFMFSKVLPVNMAQNAVDILHDHMPYFAAILIVPFLSKICFTIPIALWSQRSQDKILPYLPTAMKDYRKAANKYKGIYRVFFRFFFRLKLAVMSRYEKDFTSRNLFLFFHLKLVCFAFKINHGVPGPS